MFILWKGCKPDNFELHNSLKFSFTNYLRPSFEFCWLWVFPWVKLSWHTYSMWGKLGWLNCSWHFLYEGLSSFNLKGFYYSCAWSSSLCERTSFWTGLNSRKLWRFLLKFLTGFTSLNVLILFPLSITFFIFMHGFWFHFI